MRKANGSDLAHQTAGELANELRQHSVKVPTAEPAGGWGMSCPSDQQGTEGPSKARKNSGPRK